MDGGQGGDGVGNGSEVQVSKLSKRPAFALNSAMLSIKAKTSPTNPGVFVFVFAFALVCTWMG
jgi:hypothetical protein